LPELRLGDRGDLRNGFLDIGVRMKENFDDSDATERLRLAVLDVIHCCGKHSLGLRDDAIAHFLRVQPGIVPENANDGNIDVRENVGRRTQDDDRSQNQQQQSEDDKSVRTS
jgi:hypothetical protein